MRNLIKALVFATGIFFTSGAYSKDLKTASYVNLEKFFGKWFEIASIPQSFSEGCVNSTVTYRKIDASSFHVINECLKDGKLDSSERKAFIADTKTNSKFNLQIFWPLRVDYWVLEVGKEYDYAILGHPSRNYIWILSKESKVEDKRYQSLLEVIETKYDYDLSKIKKSIQN